MQCNLNYMYIYKFCYLVPKGNFQSYFTYKYVNILTIKITVLTLTARQQYYSPQRRHRWHSIHFSDKIPCEVSHQGRSSAHKKSFTYNHNHFRQEIVAFNTINILYDFFFTFFSRNDDYFIESQRGQDTDVVQLSISSCDVTVFFIYHWVFHVMGRATQMLFHCSLSSSAFLYHSSFPPAHFPRSGISNSWSNKL